MQFLWIALVVCLSVPATCQISPEVTVLSQSLLDDGVQTRVEGSDLERMQLQLDANSIPLRIAGKLICFLTYDKRTHRNA